jgi:hypothetical protein
LSSFTITQQKTDNTFVQPISPNFIWSEESSEKFRFALCSTEIQGKLKNFNSNTIEGTEISIWTTSFQQISVNGIVVCRRVTIVIIYYKIWL